MRHQVEKGTFSYENKERTKREKLVRTKWAFHRFGALTVGFLSLFDGMKGIVALVSSFLLIAVLAHDINTELSFNPPFTQFDYRGRI